MVKERVVVAGAGAAGLAVAAMLKQRGLDPLVLERADEVASSWRSRYDSLRLNTPRFTSTLPGYRMPRRYGRWPSRDEMVEYLDEYARRYALRIQFGTGLNRIEPNGDETGGRAAGGEVSPRWLLDTSSGELATRFVVLATGHDARPKLPEWPGREQFGGELIHSSDYRNPRPFEGKDVLVVSARNTGSEIAYELTTAGCRVWVSMRTPPNVFPREWFGYPLNYTTVLFDSLPNAVIDESGFFLQRMIYGNLAEHGIPRAPHGVQSETKNRHVSALIDAGFVDALKQGKLKLVAAVERFEGSEAVLADGARLRPQAVIAATGYERNLPDLVGHLGILDEHGVPALDGKQIRGREHPRAPGLFFNGYYASSAGQLRFMRIDGRRIARTIARAG